MPQASALDTGPRASDVSVAGERPIPSPRSGLANQPAMGFHSPTDRVLGGIVRTSSLLVLTGALATACSPLPHCSYNRDFSAQKS